MDTINGHEEGGEAMITVVVGSWRIEFIASGKLLRLTILGQGAGLVTEAPDEEWLGLAAEIVKQVGKLREERKEVSR